MAHLVYGSLLRFGFRGSTHEMGWKGIGRRPVVLASVGLNWRGSLLSGTESLRFRGHPVLGETYLISEEAL